MLQTINKHQLFKNQRNLVGNAAMKICPFSIGLNPAQCQGQDLEMGLCSIEFEP